MMYSTMLKRLRHRKILKNGYTISVYWCPTFEWYEVAYSHPDTPVDEWHLSARLVGKTPKDLIGRLRLDMAEKLNPRLEEVRKRLQGESKWNVQTALNGLNPAPVIFDEFPDEDSWS